MRQEELELTEAKKQEVEQASEQRIDAEKISKELRAENLALENRLQSLLEVCTYNGLIPR